MSNTKKLIESIQNNLNEERKDTKYIVCSYYDEKLHGLEDDLYTNEWDEVEEFAHRKLMQGNMIEIENTKTGKYKRINPDNYNEEFNGEFTIRPEELEELEAINETDDSYYKELCHQLHQLLLPFENSQDENVNLDNWLYNTGKNKEFKDIVNKLKVLGIKLKINYLYTPLNASKYYDDEYEKILSKREDNYENEPVYIIKDGEYHSLWENKEMKIEPRIDRT